MRRAPRATLSRRRAAGEPTRAHLASGAIALSASATAKIGFRDIATPLVGDTAGELGGGDVGDVGGAAGDGVALASPPRSGARVEQTRRVARAPGTAANGAARRHSGANAVCVVASGCVAGAASVAQRRTCGDRRRLVVANATAAATAADDAGDVDAAASDSGVSVEKNERRRAIGLPSARCRANIA